MARFSARPTMPPRPISASFLDSLAVRYLSAAALASASGSGLSCGKMTSGPGRSSAPSRLVRAPRLATVAMQRINLSFISPARTAVHSYFGGRARGGAAADRLVPSGDGGGAARAVLPRALRALRPRPRAHPGHGARAARRLRRPLLRVPREPDRVARGGQGEEGHDQL